MINNYKENMKIIEYPSNITEYPSVSNLKVKTYSLN